MRRCLSVGYAGLGRASLQLAFGLRQLRVGFSLSQPMRMQSTLLVPKEGVQLPEIEDVDEEESDVEEQVAPEPDLSPPEIVAQLDRHIIGQSDAKRAVSLALRNRWRRKQLEPKMRDEVMPKNILMVGPTGVGKTEIARRLAKLVNAPFIKVEATKYTETGFHGKDVDSIIQDLMEQALVLTRTKKRQMLKKKIARNVEKRILDALVGKEDRRRRAVFRVHYRQGALDEQMVLIDVPVKEPNAELDVGQGFGGVMINLNQVLKPRGPPQFEKRKMKVAECRTVIEELEAEKLLQKEDVVKEALAAVEQDGIVFLDEIDKICSSSDRHSADASAEGVQRDLLPLIEGCTISTKHGNVETDHILFIASGAFHSVKPSDLLAELQGRLPIRVHLKALTQNDFYRILTEPENNLIKQQQLLMATEGVTVEWKDEAVREVARIAFEVNSKVENIGARRLHTIIERVMEEISFTAPTKAGTAFEIDRAYVQLRVDELLKVHELRSKML